MYFLLTIIWSARNDLFAIRILQKKKKKKKKNKLKWYSEYEYKRIVLFGSERRKEIKEERCEIKFRQI